LRVALDDLSRLFSLDKKISEVIDREGESLDDYFFGDRILDEAQDFVEQRPVETKPVAKRGRGRPPGVKEMTPRKRRPNTEKIVERIERAISNLEAL